MKKVEKLDPNNLDVKVILAGFSCENGIKYVNKLEKIVEKYLIRKNEIKNEYNYDFDFEDRSLVRCYFTILQEYSNLGVMNKVIEISKKIMKLDLMDRTEWRYNLLMAYLYYEMEWEAIELYKKYSGKYDCYMTFLMAILYFRLFDIKKSKKNT